MGFKSVEESIDATTPGGRLVFHVFSALAQFEWSGVVRERTLAGLAATALTPTKLKQARRMLREGTSVTEVAQVREVSRAALYRWVPELVEAQRKRQAQAQRDDGIVPRSHPGSPTRWAEHTHLE